MNASHVTRARLVTGLLATLLLLCAGFTGDDALAQPDGQAPRGDSLWARPKLLGDIGPLRPALGQRGMSLDLRLSQYYQDVVDGGVDTGGSYGAIMDYIVNVNGEKLGLWKGLFANLRAQTQFGNFDKFVGKPGSLALANSQLLYPLPGVSQSDITGWTVAQFLTEDFMAYFGKLQSFDLQTGFFPHLAAGVKGFFNTNFYAPALPWLRFVQLSQVGGGMQKMHPRGVKYGFVAWDPVNRSETGEWDDLFEDVAALGFYRAYFDLNGLPGDLTFGIGGSSRPYQNLEPTVWDPTSLDLGGIPGIEGGTETGAWAATAYYNQILWQAGPKGERHIRLFTGVTIGSSNPGLASGSLFGTVEFVGYFASRPRDRIGVGGFYNNLASGLRDATGIIGDPLRDPSGFEVYYNAEVMPWFHVTGSLQLINSATEGTDTSVIPGVRAVIDF